jgi:hypothetical protein
LPVDRNQVRFAPRKRVSSSYLLDSRLRGNDDDTAQSVTS